MTAYIAPQTFREWHPIGIYSNINKNKPFIFNIGTLPMILWFANKTENPIVMPNVCKYIGNNLKNSNIENGKLLSPIYRQVYDESDNFGSIIKSNGLLWWSYKSNSKLPFTANKINELITPYNYQIDINIDLISFILNFISFFNNDYDSNVNYYHNKQKKEIFINNSNFKIIFKYPYTIIIRTNQFKSSHIISILPLNYNKLRLFITTYSPFTYLFSLIYFNYMKMLFETQITTDNLYIKNFFLFKKGINNKNKYLEIIYTYFKDYMFLSDYTITQFMINKNFY